MGTLLPSNHFTEGLISLLEGGGCVYQCVETNTSTGSGNLPGLAGPSPQLTLQREEGVQL